MQPASQPSSSRQIWLCADDYGISASVNTAIRDLVVRGRINATSAMVVAPNCRRADAMSLNVLNTGAQRVAIGLHLTLTAPFSPLSEGFKPLRNGAFLPLATTLAQALLHRFDHERLVAEVTSQLRAFADIFGRTPDFVDGHQHVQLFPQVRDAVLKVVKQMAPNAWIRQCSRVVPLAQRWGDRKALLLDALSGGFRRRAARLGVRTNPGFAGTYDFRDEADFAAVFPGFLDRLPDGSVVMCHPGFVDEDLRRLDPLTTLREREYAFFVDESFPRMLAAHGVALARA